MGVLEDDLDARTHVVFTFAASDTSDEQSLHRSANYAFDMPVGFGTTIEVKSSILKGGTKKAVGAGLTLTVVADAINPIIGNDDAMSLAALTWCTLTLAGSETGEIKVGLRRVSSDS